MSRKFTKSYIHVSYEKPIPGKTIGQMFNERADKVPDKEMFVFYADKERTTFRQMQDETHTFASSLLKLGLKKGDVIGLWGNAHYEYILADLAAIQIGVITVNMRIDFPLSDQQEIMKKFNMKALVLMRSPSDICDRASQIIPELLTNPADNINCRGTPSLKCVVNAGTSECKGTISLPDFMNIGRDIDKSELLNVMEQVEFDDPYSVIFSSGSSGFPKAATHSHKYILVVEAYSKLEDADGNRLPLWTRHAHPGLFTGIAHYISILMPIVHEDSTIIVVGPKYDMELMANAIQDERVTGGDFLIQHLSDFVDLQEKNHYTFDSFQGSISGGSEIPLSLRRRSAKLNNCDAIDYSATEGFLALMIIDPPGVITESPAFRPIDASEVKVVGENGQILPINEVGEICFRSLSLFMYYWGEEEKTKSAKTPDGWYHTGDLGTLDEDGHLRIVGRKAERIIQGGVNVHPGNLEKVLDDHPAVNNVMVVGVPDNRSYEEVCACIRLNPSLEVTEDELREFSRGKMSDYLVPKYVLFFEQPFPATETGKFDRRRIAELAKTMLGL